ncbi:IS30 family transposase [Mycoplana sp. BE70]|nr:IS30 family transposase [Mycoplana sp. BE70]
MISMASLWRFLDVAMLCALTLADRRRLHHLVARKVPINEMARQLGRHRSTIYREIRRNTFQDHEFPEYSGYFSTVADDIAKERRRRLRKLRRHPHLRRMVIEKLEAYWSPEQIAGRLLADGISPVRICAETIYRFIWQGRLRAWPLSLSARGPPQASSAWFEEAAQLRVSSQPQDIATS